MTSTPCFYTHISSADFWTSGKKYSVPACESEILVVTVNTGNELAIVKVSAADGRQLFGYRR